MAESSTPTASHQSPSTAVDNPFTRIRVRHYFWWALLAGFLATTLKATSTAESSLGELLADPALIAVMLSGVALQFYRKGIRWSKVFGPVPSARGSTATLMLVPLLIGGHFAGFFLVAYPLSYLAPAVLDALLSIDLSVTATDPAQQWLYDGVTIVLISLLGPLFEELLFRGVILHRWTAKWSLTTAVWASSLLFGILHGEAFLGATVVGFVMATLYLESGSLFVPLLLHAANNAFWCAMDLLYEAFPSWVPLDFWNSAADIRGTPWIGIVLLLAAGAPMCIYIRGHWPRTCAPMPYFRLHPVPLSTAN